MKKILLSILITALIMLQLFYLLLVNAKTYFGYTTDGRQIVSVDLGVQQFNYWEVQ